MKLFKSERNLEDLWVFFLLLLLFSIDFVGRNRKEILIDQGAMFNLMVLLCE
jgi:hypothetical protein